MEMEAASQSDLEIEMTDHLQDNIVAEEAPIDSVAVIL